MYDTSNYEGVIPERTLNTLIRYGKHGVPTGDFCKAVLTNDLSLACARADDFNGPVLRQIVMFLYNEMPSQCRGSVEKYNAWLAQKGQK